MGALRGFLGCACALGVASLCADAAAQGAAFRLSVDGALFQSTTIDQELDDPFSGSRRMEVSSSITTVAVFAPELRLSAGYAMASGVIVGGRLGYASVTAETEGARESRTTTQYVLAPFFEYAFLPGNTVRPAIAVSVGLEGTNREITDGEESRTAPWFEAGVWLHVFGGDSVSIAPSIYMRYSSGDAEIRSTSFGGGVSSVDVAQTNVTFGLGLTIAGWIGLDGDEPEDAAVAGPAMAPPAEAPPPAETTEPPARVTDWGDRLTTTIALPGAGLDLLATPRSEPASVGLRLTKLSRTAELSDCAMLVLSSGTGRVELPVRYESAAVSGHIEERLIVLTTVDVLERLVAEGDIRITLCTRTWEVGHSARSQLGQYVARFRALAPAAPPPTAPPPATPPPTTPPTPSGEAPPASTPEAPPALTAPPHTPPG